MLVNSAFRLMPINSPFMGRGKPDTAPAKPLFDWFKAKPGRRREFIAATGFSDGRVTNWKSRGIPLAALDRTARAMGLSYDEYMARASGKPSPKRETVAVLDPAVARNAKEEILIELYRGLFQLQQERLIVSLRALFHANQITRKELGQKPLRGVSDDQVRKAFGDAPFLRMKKIKRRTEPRRDPGTAMDDFWED